MSLPQVRAGQGRLAQPRAGLSPSRPPCMHRSPLVVFAQLCLIGWPGTGKSTLLHSFMFKQVNRRARLRSPVFLISCRSYRCFSLAKQDFTNADRDALRHLRKPFGMVRSAAPEDRKVSTRHSLSFLFIDCVESVVAACTLIRRLRCCSLHVHFCRSGLWRRPSAVWCCAASRPCPRWSRPRSRRVGGRPPLRG